MGMRSAGWEAGGPSRGRSAEGGVAALCSWCLWEARSAVGSEREEKVRDFGRVSRWRDGR